MELTAVTRGQQDSGTEDLSLPALRRGRYPQPNGHSGGGWASSLLPARRNHYDPVVPRQPRPVAEPREGGRADMALPGSCARSRFFNAVYAPSSEPSLRNAARERSAARPPSPPPPLPPPPAPKARTAPENFPPPSRPPVFKGAQQTCWYLIIEKLL